MTTFADVDYGEFVRSSDGVEFWETFWGDGEALTSFYAVHPFVVDDILYDPTGQEGGGEFFAIREQDDHVQMVRMRCDQPPTEAELDRWVRGGNDFGLGGPT